MKQTKKQRELSRKFVNSFFFSNLIRNVHKLAVKTEGHVLKLPHKQTLDGDVALEVSKFTPNRVYLTKGGASIMLTPKALAELAMFACEEGFIRQSSYEHFKPAKP